LSEEQDVVDQTNKVAEPDRAKSGHDADDQGQYRKIGQPDPADVVVARFGSG
jgi:hypothetical protein